MHTFRNARDREHLPDDYDRILAVRLAQVPSPMRVGVRATICIGIQQGNRESEYPALYIHTQRDTWLEILSVHPAPDMRGMLLKSIPREEISSFFITPLYWTNDVDARRSISPI